MISRAIVTTSAITRSGMVVTW